MNLSRNFDETSTDFTLEKLMDAKIQNFSEKVSDVSKKSTMELSLENVNSKQFNKTNQILI